MDLTLRNFSIVMGLVMPLRENFKALVHSPGVPWPSCQSSNAAWVCGAPSGQTDSPLPDRRRRSCYLGFRLSKRLFSYQQPTFRLLQWVCANGKWYPSSSDGRGHLRTIEFFLPQRHRRQQQPAEMRTLGRGLSLRTDRPGRARAARKSDRAEPVKAMSQPWVHFRLIRHGAAQTNRCPDPPAAGSGQLT